jgi:hypothetical protein
MSSILINRKELCEAFDFVKGVIPLKPIILADGNVSLRVQDGKLVVYATDGIIAARKFVEILNLDEAPKDFLAGCDPKRFSKAIAKDTATTIRLTKVDENLNVSDPAEGEDKFITLTCANMKRASVINVWAPAPEDCLNDIVLEAPFFSQVLAFLDTFTTDGKDEGGKHDVVVLTDSIAHTTNGVNLRGICASKALPFKSEISIRKRYLDPIIKSLNNLSTDKVLFKDSQRIVSLTSEDGKSQVVFPTTRKAPPVVPKEYLMSMGDASTFDVKEVVKGLDRMTTSNYNSITSLTGVDVKIYGEGANSKMQVVLEGNKASHVFSMARTGSATIEKTMDLNTFIMVLKAFSKGAGAKIFFGDEDSRYARFVDVRSEGTSAGAFIAVCSYARKV